MQVLDRCEPCVYAACHTTLSRVYLIGVFFRVQGDGDRLMGCLNNRHERCLKFPIDSGQVTGV